MLQNISTKKNVLKVFLTLGILFIASIFTFALASNHFMAGYAWSDTIGWVSFSGANYDVQIDYATGAMTGYAWGSTGPETGIGWIKFGGLSGCPGGGSCDARLDLVTNEVVGWARACAGTISGDCTSMVNHPDGWDGWISLSCRNESAGCDPRSVSGYGWVMDSPGVLSGFAWGSRVVGWLLADNVDSGIPLPEITFAARVVGSGAPWAEVAQIDLLPGEEVEFQWSSNYSNSCNGLVTGPGAPPAGDFQVTGPAGQDTDVIEPPPEQIANFTIICSNASGDTNKTIAVKLLDIFVELDIRPQIVDPGGDVNLIWDVNGNDFTTCSITGPNGYNFALNATSGSETFTNVAGESNFTLTCPPNGAYPGDTDTARVNISSVLLES